MNSAAYASCFSSLLRLMPRATYSVSPPTASAVADAVLPAGTMVRELRDGGFPIAAIAEICKVERKTVYSWLDGIAPRLAAQSRLETIHRLLTKHTGELGALHRVWNRSIDGYTLKELLCAEHLSEQSISLALTELSSAVKWHAGRDAARRARSGGAIPVLDDMPVASIDR